MKIAVWKHYLAAWAGNALLAAAAILVISQPMAASAAPLVDAASLVGSEAQPVSRDFDITLSGAYQLQLSDLGFPARLQSLKVAVTRGDQLVASAGAPGNLTFDATAGRYRLLVAGLPAVAGGFGSFGVTVQPAGGGAVLLNYSDSIMGTTVPATTGQSNLQAQFTVTTAGSHRVALADTAFPASLSTINLLVTRGGVEYARLDAARPAVDFDAPAGQYDLLVVAQAAAPSLAGLYTVRISNLSSGATVYDRSHPVGRTAGPESIDLPSTGTYTLSVTDLQFPTPLASVAAAVTRGATVIASRATAGSTSFDAAAGAIQLFTLHLPAASNGTGASSAQVALGTTKVFSKVYVDSPAISSGAAALFQSEFQAPTAATYRVALADFQFPALFSSLQLAVAQDGRLIGTRSGPGTLDFPAQPGKVQLLTAAQAAPSGSGLAGLQVSSQPGGAVAYETTQAVGALFQSRGVNVTQPGSYDLSLSDLGFPANFTELSLAVTRGTERVGSIFGGGKFSFQATAGTYFLNLIARVNSSAKFGAYGVIVDTTPPLPVVTLNANPLTVKSGQQTTLTWSTTTASSCIASDGWTGAKGTSGSQTVGPLTIDGKFTLTCTGPGGSAASSVTVTIKKVSSGGGGPIDGAFVLCCSLAWWAAARRRSSRAR